MKITKTKLKQIIKEELSSLSEMRVEENPNDAMEDIMVREDFLAGYLPPRQSEIIEGLKGVISDYLTRLQGHGGDTQAIGE